MTNTIVSPAPDIPLLGFNVWWGLRGIQVGRVDLLTALRTAGFEDYMPEPLSDLVALRRAIGRWVRARGGADTLRPAGSPAPTRGTQTTTRDLVRTINHRRSSHVVFALVGEQVDFSALGLSYGTCARIQLEKLSQEERQYRQPQLTCTTTATGEIAAENEAQQISNELQPIWQYCVNTYMSGDLGMMVQEIVEALPGAVRIRQEGGIYFVPAAQRPELERLQELIEGLPVSGDQAPYLELLGVADQAEARRTLARAIHRGLLSELQAMNHALDDLRSKAKKVGAETVAARLAEYQTVRGRAAIYKELLDMQQGEIESAVTQLQAKARGLLVGE